MGEEKVLRVLTIDGGGMRGIYTAAFLAGLAELFSRERDCGRLDIGKGFDLIVGTSTGAIVGCAAAVGTAMSDVVKLYRLNGPSIFPQKLAGNLPHILAQMPFRKGHLASGAAALETALKEVLGDETFGSLVEKRNIALSIPAVEMSQQRAWVFKTSHWNGHRDDNTTLVDACLATSAAPIFRSLAAIDNSDEIGGYRVFADGGLWANNPVLVGLIDAIKMHPTRPIQIFAAGTCPKPDGNRIKKSDLDWSIGEWKAGGVAAQLSIAAQEFAFDNMAQFLATEFTRMGRSIKLTRFPRGVLQPALIPYLDLDNTSAEAMDALIDQAAADVLLAKSACDNPLDENGVRIRDLFSNMPEF